MTSRATRMSNDRDPLRRYRLVEATPEATRTRRVRRTRRALVLLVLIVGAAIAVGWNPPVGTLHRFSEVSDYDIDRESGCTNSGEGCHGYETEYRDFNDYHPDIECTACHEYEGVGCIPCHSPRGHECPVCHDGSMSAAQDRVRLTDPYPSGHYRETTHTALGTDMGQLVKAQAEGNASAACSECHSRDLRDSHTNVPVVAGSPYGAEIGCGECHNDVRSYGMAEVLDDWQDRRCEDCHKQDASSPMHDPEVADSVETSGTLGCAATGAGCHDLDDLHALHPNAPETCAGSAEDGEPGCHDLDIESHRPTDKTCGADSPDSCHAAYVNDEYSHDHDADVHSPTTGVPATDASFEQLACGECHRMGVGGTSLTDEHAVWTSALSGVPGDVCRNCHNDPASLGAIEGDWSARDTRSACSTCHGEEGLDAAHEADLATVHDTRSQSTGCAASGPGCHPTSDLHDVGNPTVAGGIHSTCLRCHDWSASGGNRSFDPSKKACGSGRDCHAIVGYFDPETSVHRESEGVVDGTDAQHDAGSGQGDVVYVDGTSGVMTTCDACHGMVLATEHSRANSSLAAGPGTLCGRCHNADMDTASVVKESWPTRDTDDACDACHRRSGAEEVHHDAGAAHVAIEIGRDGGASPGACSKAGCHGTADLRQIHSRRGCTISGCHSATGDILGSRIKTCGGADEATSCHVVRHIVDHMADKTGIVDGVSYGVGENVGCFGCHERSLVSEHSSERADGSMEGEAAGTCSVCHANPFDAGAGTFAILPAVRSAIENHDKRCVACHASGSEQDGPIAVASPHRDISTEATLPANKVWADPFDEWETAFEDSGGGGGHNALPADLVGASQSRVFPGTSFWIRGAQYSWTLPLNSGDTAWLRTSVFGAEAETPESIQHITLTCEDCHALPDAMGGPHGAAAEVYMDADYSQTEYANPTPLASQWEATGTDRVVCLKCHSMNYASDEATPGGNPLHVRHVHMSGEPDDPQYYGAKCIDCHSRIPHAWRRPRLLVRTVVATDGVAPDEFPYVRSDHEGLLGMVLRDYDGSLSTSSKYCAVGDCYGHSSSTRHPKPSMMPTGTVFWP